jgi:outer membrane protein assembly factor BamB
MPGGPLIPWALAALLAGAGRPDTSEWQGWRGPTGMGQTEVRGLPLTWGGKGAVNVLWKQALLPSGEVRPDQNQSSPIVARGRVFVTVSYWPAGVSQKTFPEHHVLCFRSADGRPLWDTRVPPGPWLLTDLRGGYTAPTPACDGARVYALFGSAVLAALDLEGKLLWRREITPHFFDVAIGTSPVLYRDTVLLSCNQLSEKKASRLLAFVGRTGELKWERPRPGIDWDHSTPVLATVQGKPQLLAATANALEGLDPSSGAVLWRYENAQRIGDTVSPVYGAGVVYCDSGRGGLGVAVDPTGAHLKWKVPHVPEGFSSPVVVGDFLYRLHSPGIVERWDLRTGPGGGVKLRLPGVEVAASPIATPEGHIYFATAGTSYVIQVGPAMAVLARNELDDPGRASPAVAEGRLFLKGGRYLYCIGKK